MRLAVILSVAVFALAGADTITSRICDAWGTDAISADEAALYLVYSVYEIDRIPAEFTTDAVSEPCGTPAMDALFSILDETSAPIREGILDLLARPVVGSPEYTTNSPDSLFKVHWTDNGVNATNQAYVDLINDAMDWSREHMCNDLGWDVPPIDLGLGGDNLYDVYIMSLEGGTIGYCTSSGEPPDPTTPEADYASHIVIDNSGWGDIIIKETCTHEYNHALQAGYEAAEPSWFKENCATWSQNLCWDTNGYADYLHSGENCLRRPWYDIRSGAMYHYGATPWPMYMEVRCGGQHVVRQVWEACADVIGINILEAFETVSNSYGMSFMEWLAQYTAWRWFTGNQADDEHYLIEESGLWTPGPYVFSFHNHTSLPVSGDQGVYSPKTFGHEWIKVLVTDYQGWIELNFNGRDYFDWHVGIIQTKADGTDAFQYHTVTNDQATLSISVDTQGWEYVVFYFQPISISTLDLYYEYDISYLTGVEGSEGLQEPMSIAPSSNPFSSGGLLDIYLPEAGFTSINVYDLSGRIVQNIHAGALPQGENSVSWFAEDLSDGAYFIRMTAPGGAVTSRVVLYN
jgi:hypothetical protein